MDEPKIVTYPIPANECGGSLHVYGKSTATSVILCCGGFPDDQKPFTALARRLASEENCLVGIMCFPGFDFSTFRKNKFQGYKREGYSFDDVVCCFREAVARLFVELNDTSRSDSINENFEMKERHFTIILHDWGVIPGSMFINRSIEEKYSLHVSNKIVMLDVLPPPHPHYTDIPSQQHVSYSLEPSRREITVCLAYRSALAISFAVLRFLSEILGLFTMAILYGIVILLKLNPTRYNDNALVEKADINPFHLVYMCYPYFYMFQNFIYQSGFENMSLPLDLKATPILYIYGSEKNIMFHDWKSLAILEREENEKRSTCRVVRMEDAGHWMYVQKTDTCVEEIIRFLRKNAHVECNEPSAKEVSQ